MANCKEVWTLWESKMMHHQAQGFAKEGKRSALDKTLSLHMNSMTQCSAKTKAGNRCRNSTTGKRCSAHSRSVQLLDAMYKKYGLDQVTEKDWREATEYIHQMTC